MYISAAAGFMSSTVALEGEVGSGGGVKMESLRVQRHDQDLL